MQTSENISLEIVKWDSDEYTFLQSTINEQCKVSYLIKVTEADSFYSIYDGTSSMNVKSDKNGVLKFNVKSGKKKVPLTIKQKKLVQKTAGLNGTS